MIMKRVFALDLSCMYVHFAPSLQKPNLIKNKQFVSCIFTTGTGAVSLDLDFCKISILSSNFLRNDNFEFISTSVASVAGLELNE